MARKQPYDLRYDVATKKQLGAIEPKYHSNIRAEIEEQLQFEPVKEARNRKPLRQPAPFETTWEIRFGPQTAFACSMRLTKNINRSRFRPSA